MVLNHSFEDNEQWIISARGTNTYEANQVLTEITESLREYKDVTIVRLIDTKTIPQSLIIRTSANTISSIQNAFGDRIVIAPDKPLS